MSKITPNKLNGRIAVGANGDFNTIKEAVDWFNANATAGAEIILDAGTHNITDTIVVNSLYPLAIRGLGANNTTLQASTGLANKPMLELKSSCDINRLKATGSTLATYGTNPGENFITYSTANFYSEITDVQLDNFYYAIHDTYGVDVFLFNFIVGDCVKGYVNEHSGTGTTDIEVGNFNNCTIGIDLMSATGDSFLCKNVVFANPVGGTSINYDGSAYGFSGFSEVSGCTYNGVGNFVAGFDFSRRDGRDANIIFIDNIGIEDKNPHAKINVADNTTAVTVTTAGTFYKAADIQSVTRIIFDQAATAGTFTITIGGQTTAAIAYNADAATIEAAIEAISSVTDCTVAQIVAAKEWTIRFETAGEGWDSDHAVDISGLTTTTLVDVVRSFYTTKMTLDQNQMKYQPDNPRDCVMWLSGNVQVGAVNRNVTMGIKKNGDDRILSPMTVRTSTASQPVPFSMVVYLDDVDKDDYFEIWLTSSTNGDQVIIQDLIWYFESR